MTRNAAPTDRLETKNPRLTRPTPDSRRDLFRVDQRQFRVRRTSRGKRHGSFSDGVRREAAVAAGRVRGGDVVLKASHLALWPGRPNAFGGATKEGSKLNVSRSCAWH